MQKKMQRTMLAAAPVTDERLIALWYLVQFLLN